MNIIKNLKLDGVIEMNIIKRIQFFINLYVLGECHSMCVVREQFYRVPSFLLPYMSLKDRVHVSRFGGRYLYLISHPNTPRCSILIQ